MSVNVITEHSCEEATPLQQKEAGFSATINGANTPYPKQSIDWLSRLIAFDTVSRYSNLALISEVQAYCMGLGLSPVMTYDDNKTKANLFVTIPAGSDGTLCSGGVVLSGHTDVVPVDGQEWSSNPFAADIREGKLYGRGACDMKGFIACVLTLLPTAVNYSQQGLLTKPLHLALSFDEEVGCLGAPILLDDIAERGINPEFCIVGEPSNMAMVIAHKGIAVFRCSVRGKSVHSSLTPQGVNAINYAAKLIGFIEELAAKLALEGPQDSLFDVPFSTLSVGTIKGGTATNIVPNLCQFTFDYRNLPFMDADAVLKPIQQYIEVLNAQMQGVDSQTGIELEQLEDVPAMTDEGSNDLQNLMAGLVSDSARHKVAYATEGGQYTQAGIATIICGPGSIEQAHKADEFVTLEQLTLCDKFLAKLLQSLT